MAKEIQLTQGKVAIVDDEDFDRVSVRKWQIYPKGYAGATVKVFLGRQTVLMHRFIIDAGKDEQVDHVNGDKLDNRKENLRICTPTQNRANSKARSDGSGVKGVHLQKAGNYTASICHNREVQYLGTFDKIEDAKKVYDERAKELFGEFFRP